MSTRTILGTVGAAIGGYFFGPQGAQWGWAIGSAIGGAIDPEIIKGPSVGDIAQQTSQEGVPRPIVFALSQPMAGNIIASSEPKIVKKRESQGKGGPKVETESVFRTYAIGVCEGPITRFVRCWRNGQLVYDAEAASMDVEHAFHFLGTDLLTPSENANFLNTARFFLGTWDQNESPDLDPIFGIGTTPSHRGTAYMVMANEDLTDLRGAIPQWQFQVERCEGFYLTSRPYPLEESERLLSDAITASAPHPLWREAVESAAIVYAGTLGGILHIYDDYPPEAIDSDAIVTAGELREALLVYDEYPPEAIDSDAIVTGGELREALIVYDNYPPERIDSSATVLSGTLT